MGRKAGRCRRSSRPRPTRPTPSNFAAPGVDLSYVAVEESAPTFAWGVLCTFGGRVERVRISAAGDPSIGLLQGNDCTVQGQPDTRRWNQRPGDPRDGWKRRPFRHRPKHHRCRNRVGLDGHHLLLQWRRSFRLLHTRRAERDRLRRSGGPAHGWRCLRGRPLRDLQLEFRDGRIRNPLRRSRAAATRPRRRSSSMPPAATTARRRARRRSTPGSPTSIGAPTSTGNPRVLGAGPRHRRLRVRAAGRPARRRRARSSR